MDFALELSGHIRELRMPHSEITEKMSFFLLDFALAEMFELNLLH
jgi:hypothetical protein